MPARRLDIDDAMVKRWEEHYNAGASLGKIGKAHGVHRQTVRNRLHERGVTFREVNKRRPDVRTSVLVKAYESGATIRELCERTGLAYGSMHRRLSLAGVSLRGRGGPGNRYSMKPKPQ